MTIGCTPLPAGPVGGRSGLIGTVGGDSTATSHGLAGTGLGNRVKMLEIYEAGSTPAIS